MPPVKIGDVGRIHLFGATSEQGLALVREFAHLRAKCLRSGCWHPVVTILIVAEPGIAKIIMGMLRIPDHHRDAALLLPMCEVHEAGLMVLLKEAAPEGPRIELFPDVVSGPH